MARRHVLIGSGPASIAAAETIRAQDPLAEIVVVAAEPHGYYSRPGLAYYLAKEVPEPLLFPFKPQDLARMDVGMLFDRVTRIDPSAHRVRLGSGEELPYDRLLVATGSLATPLSVPGAQLDGVVKLDDLDDARDLIRRSRRAKAAVVVGGGITALEVVEGLRARRVRVHYLMRKDRYWSNVLSEAESRVVEQGLRDRGVQVHHFAELAGVLGRDGRVAAVETADGALIPCEMVAAAIGVLPRKDLGEAAGLACGRGIFVDQYMRSSDEDIFAAGDVAEAYDPGTRRRTLEVLWSSAVAKGRVAGHNMAASSVRTYEKAAPLNVTRLAGFKITIIGTVGGGRDSDLEGVARGDSETWRQLGESKMVEWQGRDARIRLALVGDTIAGAVVMGDQAISFPIQELVEARADVAAMASSLQAPSAPVADLVQRFWKSWKASHV